MWEIFALSCLFQSAVLERNPEHSNSMALYMLSENTHENVLSRLVVKKKRKDTYCTTMGFDTE